MKLIFVSYQTFMLCILKVDWNKTLLKVVSVMKSYQFLPFRCLYRIRSKYPHYMYITYVCSWYVYIYALHLPIFYSGKIAFSTYSSSIQGAPGGQTRLSAIVSNVAQERDQSWKSHKPGIFCEVEAKIVYIIINICFKLFT